MKHTKHRTRTVIILALILLLAVALSWFFINRYRDSPDDSAPRGINSVDYSGPTEEERAAGDEQKEKNEQTTNNNRDTATGQAAHVVVTDAGQYDDIIEVRSFIPDFYQDGTCTITFTQGNRTLTKEAPAYRDSSTTICTNPMIKRSEFASPGEWKLTVTYTAPDATGQSEPRTVHIN